MDPLGSTAGGLEGPPSLGAEQAFGLDAQSAGPTQPVPLRHLQDAVTRLREEEEEKLAKVKRERGADFISGFMSDFLSSALNPVGGWGWTHVLAN